MCYLQILFFVIYSDNFFNFIQFFFFFYNSQNKQRAEIWNKMTWGWVNDYIYIFERTIPLRLVFPLGTVIAEGRTENISLYLHMPSLICFPWRDPLCFVTFRHSAQGRLMCWLVSLSVCISDFMFIASTSVFMIRHPLTLPVYLVICHTSPPPSPSVFLLSLLLSFAVVNLNTHLSLEVVKQKMCLFEKLSIFLPPPSPLHG